MVKAINTLANAIVIEGGEAVTSEMLERALQSVLRQSATTRTNENQPATITPNGSGFATPVLRGLKVTGQKQKRGGPFKSQPLVSSSVKMADPTGFEPVTFRSVGIWPMETQKT